MTPDRRKENDQHKHEPVSGKTPQHREIKSQRRGHEQQIGHPERDQRERSQQQVELRRIGPWHEAVVPARRLLLDDGELRELIGLVEVAEPHQLCGDVEGGEVDQFAAVPQPQLGEPHNLEQEGGDQHHEDSACVVGALRVRRLNCFERCCEHQAGPCYGNPS
ncbi:hypothetical protein ACVI1K_002277 [Bradyrhizobium sp. USDA 4508]